MESMTTVLDTLEEPNALSPLSTAVHDEEDFAALGHPHATVESHINSDGEETLVPAGGDDDVDNENHGHIVPPSISGDEDVDPIGLVVGEAPMENLHLEVEGLDSVVNVAANVKSESLEEGDEQAQLDQHGILTVTSQDHLGETGIQDSVLLTTDADGNLAMPVSTDQVIRFLLQTSDGNVVAADAQVEAIKLSMQGLISSREVPQTVQTFSLPDGTTFVQMAKEENEEQQMIPKLIEGHAIKLEDGTVALLNPQESFSEGTLQAIQLEDGMTAFIAPTKDRLFDTSSVSVDHLQTQTLLSVADKQDKGLVIGDKAYKCMYEDCGRLYTTLHHLRVHERSHTGDRPFICEYQGCGKAFATGYGLKSHNRVHTGEKPYPCPEGGCEKAFKTSGDLQKHVRTHTGERPFKCPFEGCTRSFTTSNIRKVHIRTHTGERPYICDVEGCGRAFASATNYKNHIRIHTGEKPYVCSVQGCGKAFTEYSSLYKHHVVHTHTKPYTCCYCGKTYRQTSTLAMHKRSAHGEDLPTEGVTESEIVEPPVKKKIKLEVKTASETDTQIPVTQGDSRTQQMVLLAPQVTTTAVSSENTSPAGQDSHLVPSLVTLQSPPGTFSIADLQQSVLPLGDGQHQVLVVTDPAQLELLQQFATQQLESGNQGSDGIGQIETISTISVDQATSE